MYVLSAFDFALDLLYVRRHYLFTIRQIPLCSLFPPLRHESQYILLP